MEFGYHHNTFRSVDEPGEPMIDATVRRARRLDELGFSLLTVMDHMWQLPGNGQRDEPFLDCYTALTVIARATEEIELGGLVTCPHYRTPGYLARTMASLEHVSDGRAVLGIGAGWYEDEYEAMDLEFPDISTRNRQMRETIELCRAAWRGESPVSFEGEHYRLDEFYCEPSPDREVPVLIGGAGEALTLRATAEYADRWNVPFGDPETYAGKLDVLAEHCERYDRDPDEIDATIAITTLLREDPDEAHDVYEELLDHTEEGPTPRDEFRGAVGTPAEVRDLVAEYEDVGADTFMIKIPGNDRRTLELFADEVMPAFE